MITFDQLIKNVQKVDRRGAKLLQQEIFNLFEPIVYQVVLLTRMDTGTSRASLGVKFAREVVPSQRILDAVDYDVEVQHAAYYHWTSSAHINPMTDYRGIVKKLVDGKKIQVEVISYEDGVINQENGYETGLPQPEHPRKRPERHILHHIDQVARVITHSDLEHFASNGIFLDNVAKDIRDRVNKLFKKVEELLFT
jgi:hypothetical protein